MRRFKLIREEDDSGVSGTGEIAEGVEFTGGKCVLRWLTATASTNFYDSMKDVKHIHGHGGHTKVQWVDPDEFEDHEVKE